MRVRQTFDLTLTMQLILLVVVVLALLPSETYSFTARSGFFGGSSCRSAPRSCLFMGRAAAVRAATKARTDGAKAKNNNRFAKKIIMVVKAGGADPIQNRALAAVLAEAKVANVPNDVIKRNIEKASAASTADFKESLFEFVGPGGAGLLVNVLTDNDNRAASEVNLVGKKNALKSGSKGSVSFNFVKKSKLQVSAIIDEDKLMELCLEAGVDDYDLRTVIDGNPSNPTTEGQSIVYVDMKDMSLLRDALQGAGYALESSISSLPKDGYLALSDEDFEANQAAIDAFLALDDVDSVEHNIDMTGGDDDE
jgi:YebC/PmpR family DNA-binding regulatory protein